jgi:hypothetical protein
VKDLAMTVSALWMAHVGVNLRLASLMRAIAVGALVYGVTLATPAAASEKASGIGLGFIEMQKLWQGLTEKPRMTTCRLATRQTYRKKQICVYTGANKTFVAIYNSAGAFCNNELRCRYDPDRSKSVSGYVRAFRASQK